MLFVPLLILLPIPGIAVCWMYSTHRYMWGEAMTYTVDLWSTVEILSPESRRFPESFVGLISGFAWYKQMQRGESRLNS